MAWRSQGSDSTVLHLSRFCDMCWSEDPSFLVHSLLSVHRVRSLRRGLVLSNAPNNKILMRGLYRIRLIYVRIALAVFFELCLRLFLDVLFLFRLLHSWSFLVNWLLTASCCTLSERLASFSCHSFFVSKTKPDEYTRIITTHVFSNTALMLILISVSFQVVFKSQTAAVASWFRL